MFSALTRTFTHSTDAGRRHSAAIDAQLAIDHQAARNTVHVLVLGLAGGGKSALLRLLAPGGDAPDITQESVARDGGGVEEDGRSTVSSVTLTPSGDHVAGQQEAGEKAEGKDDVLNRRAAGSINEVMVEDPRGLRLLFAEVPSTLSRKVMHQFEHGASAVVRIVYPLDLSSYADTDTAPASPNQLQASLDFLESLLHNPLFYRMEVVVLFTKADRLAVKLPVTPFRHFFPMFEGDETVRGVAEYVLTLVKQLDIYNPGRKLCVCPAVLNLDEEDGASRAVMRAGVLLFVTEIILAANLVMVSCFGSPPPEEVAIGDVVLDEVAKGAWDGVVLEGWELKNR